MLEDKRKQRYREKLERLEEYQLLFEKWFNKEDLPKLEKEGNFERIFAIYHSIQLIIEAISDIISMILRDSSIIVEDNYSNFQKLLKREIISPDMFQGLKKLNGLRNRIVHDYNGIIDEIAWETIDENKKYFKEFEQLVKKWIEQQD